MTWLLIAVAVIAVSGVPGLLLPRVSSLGQTIAVVLMTLGCATGLVVVGDYLAAGGPNENFHYRFAATGGSFHLPIDDILHVGLDELSALFLITIFFVPLCGSIYALGYWSAAEHPRTARKMRFFYGLLSAALATVVVARHAVLFLFAWEAMALSAYFLVTTDDDDLEVREAGWIYLVATHTATLLLFGLFGMFYAAQKSFAFGAPLPTDLSPTFASAIFLTALLGFGLKAGVMPLHVWLPGAHAMAPSHVSAIMSGVIIKMGVYGLIRTVSLLPNVPVWWGGLILVLGVISGLLGIAYAVGQQELKRLLAYSSVENIGVIFIGLGLSLLGRAYERPELMLLGMAGALLHVLNHGLFKSLLFFGAGAVIHVAHTRQMNLMGGLAKRMPRTATCFLIGAAATCALPPTNGFISEFLIYLGLFHGVMMPHGTFLAMAAPALASIGALAVAAMVGAYGTVLLGVPRSERTANAHESPASMWVPMGLTAIACLVIGLAPMTVVPLLQRAAVTAVPELAINEDVSLASLAPLDALTLVLWILFALLIFGGLMLRHRMTQVEVRGGATWGCGYAAPTPRMQYTPTSLAQMLMSLFGWALQPRERRPVIRELFPQQAEYEVRVDDVVLDRAIQPAASKVADRLLWFRWMQQGSSQAYLAYVFVILVVLFLWR